MFPHLRAAVAALALLPAIALAQHGGTASSHDPATTPPAEAKQFDFLLGEWELTVTPKVAGLAAAIHGAPKLHGTWKVWRALDGWGVEDEMRIVDASANPLSFTHALRVYDAAARRWNVSVLDVHRASFTTVTAVWMNGEMILSSSGTDAEGKAYIARTRIYSITPDGFSYQLDRSYDGGKRWTEGVTRIAARRTAPASPR